MGNSSGQNPGFATSDHVYGRDRIMGLARYNSTLALNNADTYALYAMFAHLQCSEVTELADRKGDEYSRTEVEERINAHGGSELFDSLKIDFNTR